MVFIIIVTFKIRSQINKSRSRHKSQKFFHSIQNKLMNANPLQTGALFRFLMIWVNIHVIYDS